MIDFFNSNAVPSDQFPNTRHGIVCPVHQKQGLSYDDYLRQLSHPHQRWVCPICGVESVWDDERYEDGTAWDDDPNPPTQ